MKRNPVIIGLDLATTTGVAVGRAGEVPMCETKFLGEAGKSQAARFSQMLRLTKSLIEEHRPDLIAIEKPISAGPVGKEARVQMAFGLRGNVLAMANIMGVRCKEYAVQDVRQHFIGERNLPRAVAKEHVMARCGLIGWSVDNDNEGDAAAVWEYARAREYGLALMPEGLFTHADRQPIRPTN